MKMPEGRASTGAAFLPEARSNVGERSGYERSAKI